MNFKFTKAKVIWSVVIGIIFFLAMYMIIWPFDAKIWIFISVIVFILTYILWSIFQKGGKK